MSVSFAPWCLGITNYKHTTVSLSLFVVWGQLEHGEESEEEGEGEIGRTAWPLERGLMSRNAKTLSDSKILKEGMSPGGNSYVSYWVD